MQPKQRLKLVVKFLFSIFTKTVILSIRGNFLLSNRYNLFNAVLMIMTANRRVKARCYLDSSSFSLAGFRRRGRQAVSQGISGQ